jgi:hypothetical protein
MVAVCSATTAGQTMTSRSGHVRTVSELTTDQTPFWLRGVSVKATKQASIQHGEACNDSNTSSLFRKLQHRERRRRRVSLRAPPR